MADLTVVGDAIFNTPPDGWGGWLRAWSVPATGAFVAFIGYLQWWTAKNKLNLDLFDRRWAVYNATREALYRFARDLDPVPFEDLEQFYEITQGARWLFVAPVGDYVDDLKRRMQKIQKLRNMLSSPVSNLNPVQKEEVNINNSEETRWLLEQLSVNRATNMSPIATIMGPYLMVDQPLPHVAWWRRSKARSVLTRSKSVAVRLWRTLSRRS